MTVKDLSMAAWPFWLKRLTVFLKKLPKFGLNAASVITEAAGSFLMRLSHGSGGAWENHLTVDN